MAGVMESVNATTAFASLDLSKHVSDAWVGLFALGSPGVVSVAATFVIHECAYFGSYLPFLIADFIPALHKYKIQPRFENTWPVQWHCLRRLLFNHIVIQLPLMCLLHPLLSILGMSYSLPLPSWHTLVWQCFAAFVVEDFYFYWIHRFLHWKAIYKHIHKIHHDHAAPFGITAEYAHPVETVFLGIGTMLGPIFFMRHVATLWVWLVVRLFQTVEVHSGYDFPWSLNRIVPFWGGADFHDFHHKENVGNFASTFIWWDWAFGTDSNFYRSKERQIKKSGKEE